MKKSPFSDDATEAVIILCCIGGTALPTAELLQEASMICAAALAGGHTPNSVLLLMMGDLFTDQPGADIATVAKWLEDHVRENVVHPVQYSQHRAAILQEIEDENTPYANWRN